MKKNYLYTLLLLIVFAGCDNLDLVPISNKSVEGFYTNEKEIDQALIACYGTAQVLYVSGSYSYMMTESRSDNAMQEMAYDDGPISAFSETPMLVALNSAWAAYYKMIYQCNRVLEALPEVELSESTANQFEGEAKFFRALAYFDLVRFFGDVPLVTKTLKLDESYNVTRSSVENVYIQIENDMKDAAGLLPSEYATSGKGRATKWAAKGFLGKILIFESGYPLKKNRWADAKTVLQEVIQSGKFSFFAKYEDIFKYENENKAQSVFSVLFKSNSNGEGNPFPTRNAPNTIIKATVENGGLPYGGGPNQLFLTNDLLNSFEPGDLRKTASIRFEWKNNTGVVYTNMPFCKKYQDGPVSAASDWDIDWIMLRYDDVLMMYAECLNEIGYASNGEAFSILNQIRARAGLLAKTATDVPNQQSYRLWMEQERRHEFCFENIRWFDLVRTDRALEVMQAFLGQYGMAGNLKSRDQYIYPIPQRVLNENKNIQQNPGYN